MPAESRPNAGRMPAEGFAQFWLNFAMHTMDPVGFPLRFVEFALVGNSPARVAKTRFDFAPHASEISWFPYVQAVHENYTDFPI